MTPWSLDAIPVLLTPADVRRELGVSPRWFAYQRARRKGSATWEPAERQHRGYKGEIGFWRPEQVARMRAEILAERRRGTVAAAVDRLGHGRAHAMELRRLGALAWDLVRGGVVGAQLREIGCDVPLRDVPRRHRALARAVLERELAKHER